MDKKDIPPVEIQIHLQIEKRRICLIYFEFQKYIEVLKIDKRSS